MQQQQQQQQQQQRQQQQHQVVQLWPVEGCALAWAAPDH
jgi:hypothetical protein